MQPQTDKPSALLCSRPKGFGFVEYMDERDAEDAMYAMDGKLFGGREIAVCWFSACLVTASLHVILQWFDHRHQCRMVMHVIPSAHMLVNTSMLPEATRATARPCDRVD